MRRRIVALLGVLAVAAGCGGGAAATVPLPTLRTFVAPPTLGLSTPSAAPSAAPSIAPSTSTAPSATASAPPSATAAPTTPPTATPTATPAPTPTAPPSATDSPAPTAPPTETPSPSATGSGAIDRTSEDALRASLLQLDDMPTGVTEQSDTLVTDTSDITGFTANKGIRAAGRQFDGTVVRVIDERWQFASKAAAHKFFGAADEELGGVSQGLALRTDGKGFADESAQYEGTNIAGAGAQVFVQVLRVKNVVARVQVIGPDSLTAKDADLIGDAAAVRMEEALLGDFPNAEEADVIAHVPVDIAKACNRIFEIYWAEIESVRCRPSGGPLVDYSVFATQAAMDADYDDDLDSAGKPTTDGTCATGKYQNTYNVDGVPTGRLMCVKRGTSRVIEWTNEPLLIITYISSTSLSFDKLHDFWANDAGPYENP
jgi:hypothetical protein